MPALTPADHLDLSAHPHTFGATYLGARYWGKQRLIQQSVLDNPYTSARGATAIGKTFQEAGLALWWVKRWDDGIVIAIMPKFEQIRSQFMGEVQEHIRRGHNRMTWPEPLIDRLELGPKRFIIGISPGQDRDIAESALGGTHSGHMLILLLEASGLKPFVYSAVDGLMSGGFVRVLESGNPLSPDSEYASHHIQKRAGIRTIRISAFDTPNFAFLRRPEDPPNVPDAVLAARLLECTDEECEAGVVIPSLTRARWARNMIRDHGLNHPRVVSRVLANFPQDSEHSVIKLALAEAARDRPAVDKGHPIDIGIDPAGPGKDECAACAVAGEAVLAEDATQDADPRGWALAFIRRFNGRVRSVRVDANGLGYGFALHLADQPDLADKVVFVKHGNADDTENFANNTAEDWQGLADVFAAGAISGVSEATIVQLLGLEWDVPDPRGRQRIKDKHKGGKSPDRGEALRLAVCRPPPAAGDFWPSDAAEVEDEDARTRFVG